MNAVPSHRIQHNQHVYFSSCINYHLTIFEKWILQTLQTVLGELAAFEMLRQARMRSTKHFRHFTMRTKNSYLFTCFRLCTIKNDILSDFQANLSSYSLHADCHLWNRPVWRAMEWRVFCFIFVAVAEHKASFDDVCSALNTKWNNRNSNPTIFPLAAEKGTQRYSNRFYEVTFPNTLLTRSYFLYIYRNECFIKANNSIADVLWRALEPALEWIRAKIKRLVESEFLSGFHVARLRINQTASWTHSVDRT